MSTRVLLATLSIPITPERTDIARLLDMDGIIVEKHRRLATLLGLQSPPTRQSLINDMVISVFVPFIGTGFSLFHHVLVDFISYMLILQHHIQHVGTFLAGEIQSSPVYRV